MSALEQIYWDASFWVTGYWADYYWPSVGDAVQIGGYPFPVGVIEKLYEKYSTKRKSLTQTVLVPENQAVIDSQEIIGEKTPKSFLTDLSRYDDVIKTLEKTIEEKLIEDDLSDRLDRLALLLYQRMIETEEIFLLLLM